MVTTGDGFVIAESVGRTFGTGHSAVTALAGVDLRIDAGRLTVVLGPSGSGKSTLLNLLGGMDSPSTGVIRVGADRISELTDAGLTEYRRRTVGFVFQFYNLIAGLTARENVALAASLVMGRRDAARIAEELLDQVGLAHRAGNFPAQLSGGEMQRVAIARALSKKPAVLLCDEPSGALDSRTGGQVLSLLQRTARTTGTAVVVVTHDQSLATAADRVIRLRDGHVVDNTVNESPDDLHA